ncbi:hypothetical protein [Kitasatospora sp. NPDC006786]
MALVLTAALAGGGQVWIFTDRHRAAVGAELPEGVRQRAEGGTGTNP